MTIEIGTYIRKPFQVKAVQVTAENLAEVAKWCKGNIKELEGKKFVLVKVHNAVSDRHKQAFDTDWIFYSKSTGYKVYSDRAFKGSFEKQVFYTEADAKTQLGEALEEEKNDTKPEIPVAQVLVDTFNAVHGVPEKAESSEIVLDDGECQHCGGEGCPACSVANQPDIKVAETSELSPEDQARLS